MEEASNEAADDDGSQQQQQASPAKPDPAANAHGHEAQSFMPARNRRMPVSGEFARERLRARGGIQPR